MKILYLHQFFKTPHEPGGTRSYWISRELIARGHEVHMITSNKKIEGKVEKVVIDGIHVTYLNVMYDSGNMSLFQRFAAFMKFVLKATPQCFSHKNVDLVIATSTPLTIGIPALLLKKISRVPYVFEVRDLWPEVPIQMGGLRNPIAIYLAKWLEKKIYKNAIHIVALSPGMQEGIIRRGIPRGKTSMIPNMSKIDEFYQREPNPCLIKELGLENTSLKVIYFGAINIANKTSYITEAAKLLKDDPSIKFVFVGKGAEKQLLVDFVDRNALKNVGFLNNVPMKELSEIVNIFDVSLVTFDNIPILATNSPNKLFDSLSAGKAIIVNSRGWTKEMVETHECGFFTDPEKPEELACVLRKMSKDPVLVRQLGSNSRKLAETTFDKGLLCVQFADIITSLKPTHQSPSISPL